ncbi:hypothetical protein [Haloterrigena alkaliphila]|uniref:Uncharacterized protein n=1 Tax=Haloterrigena alkaliphila TaxID=2816475 RepID=A0A8A2VGZ6_9EURY|nr:hypothetical protein [Haloterrigena alkaliphila]QSX00617.1 hypothetical protein J0X25_06570 [Haloterrigena alkaliphila]
MSDTNRRPERETRTTNVLLVLILVTLAAGFLHVGEGTGKGSHHVVRLILSTMLWGPLLVGGLVLFNRL